MDKLTQAQWNELTPEEQLERAGEKPDPQDKGTPSAEELKKQLDEVNQKIKDMEDKHKQEMSGTIYDLKQERTKRQELEKALESKQSPEKDLLDGRADEDIVTVGDVKRLRVKEVEEKKKEHIGRLRERAAERMDLDEDRMQERTTKSSERYPIPYDEALKAFEDLARKDPKLWDEVHREALRPGGKPAEKMYRIAVEDHPDIRNKAKKSEREKIIEELEKEGKIPKHISGGGAGGGEVDIANMSDEDLLKLAETNPTALDKAAGKK